MMLDFVGVLLLIMILKLTQMYFMLRSSGHDA